MKISALIKELAEVQMNRGDVEVMMEYVSIPDDELAVFHEKYPESHLEAIEGVVEVQNGLRFFAQLHP